MRSFSRFVAILVSILIVSAAFVAAEEKEAAFSQAELDQMLAPVALYPDTLLSQILMASTYPLEVVEASRWSRQNPGLEGARAVDAVADKDWDPSVKALVAFPQVLELMNKDLEWTRRLGEAFLIQEAQVMDTIQWNISASIPTRKTSSSNRRARKSSMCLTTSHGLFTAAGGGRRTRRFTGHRRSDFTRARHSSGAGVSTSRRDSSSAPSIGPAAMS